MPAKRKAKKKAARPKGPDYPLLTRREYEMLSPQQKVAYLAWLRSSEQERDTRFDKLFEESPRLIEKGMDMFSAHEGHHAFYHLNPGCSPRGHGDPEHNEPYHWFMRRMRWEMRRLYEDSAPFREAIDIENAILDFVQSLGFRVPPAQHGVY